MSARRTIDRERVMRLLDEGFGITEISRQLEKDRTAIQNIVSQERRKRAGASANLRPPVEAVPEGFHLSSVATTVDADGKTRSQSFRAKSGDEGDVVPANGAFPAPDGMFVRSTSTLVDGQTGVVKQQWVKADKLKEDALAAIMEASLRAAERVTPRDFAHPPIDVDTDLAQLYTVTDYHFGMLAWKRETGDAWDLAIAKACLLAVFQNMLAAAPRAATGILNQLGDCLHFDGLKALTPEHGNLLDADSRYQKVVEVVVEVLCTIVDMMLEKHDTIVIYMHEGNHDQAGSVWLRVLFATLFKNNPRVRVETSPLPYVAYQHGETMLAFHHGHLSKNEALPLLFATKFPGVWGATTKRYGHTGHRHHEDIKEHPGMKINQHATLASPDAHSARGGWDSQRQIVSITYHKQRGEIIRSTFLPA